MLEVLRYLSIHKVLILVNLYALSRVIQSGWNITHISVKFIRIHLLGEDIIVIVNCYPFLSYHAGCKWWLVYIRPCWSIPRHPLYIFVHVEAEQGIHTEGLNLYSDTMIDYTDAVLGTYSEGELSKLESSNPFLTCNRCPQVRSHKTYLLSYNWSISFVNSIILHFSSSYFVLQRLPLKLNREFNLVI